MKKKIVVLFDQRERDLWNALYGRGGQTATRPVSLLRECLGEQKVSERDNDIFHELKLVSDTATLPVGDIWFLLREEDDKHDDNIHHEKHDNKNLDEKVVLIWERKTVSDVWSSIRDGRYHEQKDRLFDFCRDHPSCHGVFYVLEGPCPTLGSDAMSHSTFFKIMTRQESVTVDHDEKPREFKTIRSFHLQETLVLIDACRRHYEKHILNDSEKQTDMSDTREHHLWRSLSSAKIKQRHEHVTPTVVLASCLASIPRVSFECALRIAEEFQTLEDFIVSSLQNHDIWYERVMSRMKTRQHKLVERIQSFVFRTTRVPPLTTTTRKAKKTNKEKNTS